MKIIQIVIDTIENSRETSERLLGLSDEGKLYYWQVGRQYNSGRSGWVLIKDEIND